MYIDWNADPTDYRLVTKKERVGKTPCKQNWDKNNKYIYIYLFIQ